MSSWERGYGDFVMQPDLDDAAARPLARRHGDAARRPAWHDGTPVVASPRQILRAPARAPRRARLDGRRRHRARVHRLPRHLRGGVGARLPRPRPANLYNVDYSLLGTARVEPLHPPHPQRDGAAPGCASRTPRASATSASTRSTSATPTRCAPPTSTRSTRTAPRRSPPRRAWRSRSWRSSTSARATRATSTCRCARGRRAVRRRAGRRSTRFVAGQLATLRELTLFYAPNINSYKRFAARLVRADRGALGPRQPHLRAARRRPRPVAARREPRARRRRQPVPRARRDDRRRAARHRRRASSSSPRSRATPTRPTSRSVPGTLREARDLFAASAVARAAFGEEVVDHYLNDAARRARRLRRAP